LPHAYDINLSIQEIFVNGISTTDPVWNRNFSGCKSLPTQPARKWNADSSDLWRFQEKKWGKWVSHFWTDPTLAERIRKWRLERGLFQVDLAKRVGVSEMTIVNWEKGRTNPVKEYFEKL
jgi:uncharacterized damage-inducible protein DinB